jgi:hypothetical protein
VTEALEQQREDEEPASVDSPSALPSDAPIGAVPASDDSWESVQSLLDEYDSKVASPPKATSDNAQPNGQDTLSNDQLDQFIAELSGPTAEQKRIGELEGAIGSLRTAELQRQSKEDFDKFSSHLQGQLGPNVDSEFARTNLLAMVAQKPELEIAWSFRNLTDAQLRAADQEFRQLEALYFRLQHAPNDPRKAQAMAQLERRGQELGLMMNARTMIANARRDVLSRAKKAPPEIDIEATLDRDMIAQSIRDGQGPINIPEEKPNFGIMDDRTFRDYTKRHYGF